MYDTGELSRHSSNAGPCIPFTSQVGVGGRVPESRSSGAIRSEQGRSECGAAGLGGVVLHECGDRMAFEP
jgi:hypothetical protein